MKKYTKKENYTYNFSDEWNRKHNKYKIIKQYKKYLTGKVGELGSNSGYQCFLAAEFNNVKSVIGVDLNKEAVKFGNTKIRNKFPKKVSNKVKLMAGNLQKLPIEDSYFDAIISFHTLEHIYPKDLKSVLEEKYRVLKDGGYFIVSLPYKKAYPCDKHVNFFDEDSLDSVLTNAGFKKIELYIDDRAGKNEIKLCLTGVYKK